MVRPRKINGALLILLCGAGNFAQASSFTTVALSGAAGSCSLTDAFAASCRVGSGSGVATAAYGFISGTAMADAGTYFSETMARSGFSDTLTIGGGSGAGYLYTFIEIAKLGGADAQASGSGYFATPFYASTGYYLSAAFTYGVPFGIGGSGSADSANLPGAGGFGESAYSWKVDEIRVLNEPCASCPNSLVTGYTVVAASGAAYPFVGAAAPVAVPEPVSFRLAVAGLFGILVVTALDPGGRSAGTPLR